MLFVVSFFIKNLLVSGCFAFPIEKTCLTKVFWYDLNSNRGSNAKMTMLENEAWTKGWSDQKKNRKNFEEYLSSLDWVTLWSKNHGKRALIKMIPFLFLLIVISLIIFRFASDEKNTNLQKNNLSYKKIFFDFSVLKHVLDSPVLGAVVNAYAIFPYKFQSSAFPKTLKLSPDHNGTIIL